MHFNACMGCYQCKVVMNKLTITIDLTSAARYHKHFCGLGYPLPRPKMSEEVDVFVARLH